MQPILFQCCLKTTIVVTVSKVFKSTSKPTKKEAWFCKSFCSPNSILQWQFPISYPPTSKWSANIQKWRKKIVPKLSSQGTLLNSMNCQKNRFKLDFLSSSKFNFSSITSPTTSSSSSKTRKTSFSWKLIKLYAHSPRSCRTLKYTSSK
jgi:hypothetical protein